MDLPNVLNEFKNEFKNELHTCIPCKVVAVDNDRVDVKPIFKGVKVGKTREVVSVTGEYLLVDDYEQPIIINCPIIALVNSNARITVPIEVDDQGLLLISERDINNWRDDKSDSLNSLRKFNINDGFFLPFINQEITSYNHDAVEISYKGQEIKITDSKIEVTGDMEITGELTVDDLVVTNDATIGGISFLTHTHSYVSPSGPAVTGVPE